jgi:hypothetical protein
MEVDERIELSGLAPSCFQNNVLSQFGYLPVEENVGFEPTEYFHIHFLSREAP